MAVVGTLLSVAPSASAFSEVSGPDHSLPATAQVVPAAEATITGSLDGTVDMYRISINDPAAFSAEVLSFAGDDSEIYLFDSTGHFVTFNDDYNWVLSRITMPTGELAGDYYFAMAIWPQYPLYDEAGVLSGWENTATGGAYNIALTGVGPLGPGPAMTNGGFESGDFTGWTLRRTGPSPVIDTAVVKSGTYSAHLGASIPSGNADSQIMQSVAVPATGTTTLDVELWPWSVEYRTWGNITACMRWDWQQVLVYDQSGGLHVLMHTCSDARAWQHLSFDLTPYAGTTISLVFGAKQDTSLGTGMRVDDVSVTNVVPSVATTTVLTSDVNPSVFGQAVGLTATVAADSGSDVPTGTVQFKDGSTLLSEVALNSFGVATLSVTDFGVGSHPLTAVYVPGNDGFTDSTSAALAQAVDKAATTTALTVDDASVAYGTGQAFTANVSVTSPGAGTPTGQVEFRVDLGNDDTVEQTESVNLDGSSALFNATLPAGTHRVSARYLGSDTLNATPEPVSLDVVVTKAPTTVVYTGAYLVLQGKSLNLSAVLSSDVTACTTSRTVSFVLSLDGVDKATIPATYSNGKYTATLPVTTAWAPDVYDVKVQVVEGDNCLGTSTDEAVTVAAPGDAANGGGWYQLSGVDGAAKRINFGFTTRMDKATDTYKGNLLLINKQAWRLKGDIDLYGVTSTSPMSGTASGTGELYQAIEVSDGVWEWSEQSIEVTFAVAFNDKAGGGGKKPAADEFRVGSISYAGAHQLLSGLAPLKGGNITIR